MSLNLHNFPNDILENIFHQNAASDRVVAMWLCGDRTFNARLSRGACTSFVAHVTEVLKWPRMLSELKSLRRLVIRAYLLREPIQWMHGEFAKLSSTLEEIRIDFPHATVLVLDSPNYSSTSPYFVNAKHSLPAPVLIDIGKHFPKWRIRLPRPPTSAHDLCNEPPPPQ